MAYMYIVSNCSVNNISQSLNYTYSLICLQWCNILCFEDNKTQLVMSSKLETEERDSLTPGDLHVGAPVIWRFKGVPYDLANLDITAFLNDVLLST